MAAGCTAVPLRGRDASEQRCPSQEPMMSAPARDPWVVVDYEVMMYAYLGIDFTLTGTGLTIWTLSNTVTESRVLHTRSLCDILLSRCPRDDDIRLVDILPAPWPPTLTANIAKLRDAYGDK